MAAAPPPPPPPVAGGPGGRAPARRARAGAVPLGSRAADWDGDGIGFAEESIGDESATAALAAALDRDELGRALRKLPESHRRVIVLKFFGGLEIHELCAALGCSRPT